jgi:aminomethyltransferase
LTTLEPPVQRTATLKRTPFHAYHQALGARIVEFAGFEMPVRYAGDVQEHVAVRQRAGLFDISHMGEFHVAGDGALEFLNDAITNDVAAIEVGQALYSPLCRPDGDIVDDLLVYRSSDHFMVVVNASNIAKDFAWLKQHCPAGVVLEDRSDETALLAVQGPRTDEVLRGHVPDEVLNLGYYRFAHSRIFDVQALISRTGYTGEDGFEIFFDPAHAARVWEGLVEAGKRVDMEPIGLGARDTLRLEMGFMLYGNDIDDTTTPLEAGLGWTVKMSKRDFVSKEALTRQKSQGLLRRLVGFELEGRRVARHGMAIEAGGHMVGQVTSGTYSPSLEHPIAMGYVEIACAEKGTVLDIVAKDTRLPARVVSLPFYKHGSRRK